MTGCTRCLELGGKPTTMALTIALVLAILGIAWPARAQPPNLANASSPGPFTFQAELPIGSMRVVGDTGLAAEDGAVRVFDRDPATDVWTETASLVPSDGASGFGRSLDFDGTRALVGADGATYLFRRSKTVPPVWREVVKLMPSDGNPMFGRSVAIDRDTVLVSGPFAQASGGPEGAVYVFNRIPGQGWREVKLLTSPEGSNFGFGTALDLSKGTAIIAKPAGGVTGSAVYVFDRHEGGPDNWGLVKRFPETGGFQFLGGLAIDGDTLMIGRGEIIFAVGIYERNRGGLNQWGEVTQLFPAPGSGVAIDGDKALLTDPVVGNRVDILARNQGGKDAWGSVAQFRLLDLRFSIRGSSISHDTASLLYAPRGGSAGPSVLVYVSDEDGDGVRDALDACPRDPFNNVSGGCQRETSAYPVLDELIAQTGLETASPAPRRFVITATFTNTSAVAVRNPFFEVTSISGTSALLNGDGEYGGVGATLSPDVGDGILQPGESMTVDFVIRRRPPDASLSFYVTFKGEPID